MRFTFFILFSFLFIQSESALALNRKRCAQVYRSTSGLGKKERHLLKAYSATTSTAQFMTSTGKCRLVGGISNDERKLFIADNSEQLKIEIVQAEGEYLTTVANLYKCDSQFHERFAFRIQQNATKILGEDFQNNPLKISEELDSLINNDPNIKTMCGSLGA